MSKHPWWRRKEMQERETDAEFLERLKIVEEEIEVYGHRWCPLCWKKCTDQKHRDRHMKKVHGIGVQSDKQQTLPV